jgi:hypothetical protein
MTLDKHGGGTAPADVLLMKAAGTPIERLPLQYRFDALLAAIGAHNVEATEALVDAGIRDILTHRANGQSFADLLCQMMGQATWRRCNCGTAPGQFEALLAVVRRMHVGASPIYRHDTLACLAEIDKFEGHVSFVCHKLPAHGVVQARRLEVAALLKDALRGVL